MIHTDNAGRRHTVTRAVDGDERAVVLVDDIAFTPTAARLLAVDLIAAADARQHTVAPTLAEPAPAWVPEPDDEAQPAVPAYRGWAGWPDAGGHDATP